MSNWPGNLIRKTPVTPAGPFQNGAAPGIWSLAEASYWTKQGLWPTAGNFLAVEDVFSTWLYTGTGGAQTITNGIDLAGKGGLVWLKRRGGTAQSHGLFDTSRGENPYLSTDNTSEQLNFGNGVVYNSNGFTNKASSYFGGSGDGSGLNYVSWTFREAPNFFDVVTWTGNGANRSIAHNLQSVPGMIIVKRTDTLSDWQVYHRSNANTQYMVLNGTAAVATGATRWNSTTPTATEFTVGTDTNVNASGGTYVAYLYAHDTSSTGLIQCGSFTTNGSGAATVNLGWEPQWLIGKTTSAGPWYMADNIRNMSTGSTAALLANSTSSESTSTPAVYVPTATGFQAGNLNGSQTYIYVAIRRGPMKTPTLGTSVFSPNTSSALADTQITTNFPVDMQFPTILGGASTEMYVTTRLTGVPSTITADNFPYLNPRSTAAETSFNIVNNWNNTGFAVSSYYSNSSQLYWNFRRAPGFFDVVCWTNTGATQNVNHNLGVAPELIITKRRPASEGWQVYSAATGASAYLVLNTTAAVVTGNTNRWNATAPTSTVFTTGTAFQTSEAYVAYLFASCPGVSKVGTYTGNGSSQTINCAFTTGARYVLIKRTDSTGDWLVWDSARGIVAGNDPYVAVNSSAAQVTTNDSVDTDSTGFVVNQVAASNVNVNGAAYIFLAIA